MTKEEFCQLIAHIREREEKWNKLWRLIGFHDDFNEMRYLDDLVTCLERLFDDEDDTISYWIWELEFGEQYKPGSVMLKKNPGDEEYSPVCLRTAENLFNYLANQPDWEECDDG